MKKLPLCRGSALLRTTVLQRYWNLSF